MTVSAVVGNGDRQFDLAFADQTLRGAYRLTIGPDVTDVVGNPMNQDGNASNGEATDLYSSTVSFDSTTPTLGSAPVLFSEGFESWPPVPDYWSFGTAGTGTVAVVTTDSPKAGLQHLKLAAHAENQNQWATLKLDLSGHTNATDLFLDFWVRLIDQTSSGQFYVELSGDGQAWRTVWNFDPPASYQNYVMDLDAELAAGSIALDTNVFIRFRQVQQNAYLYGPKYRVLLDEVRVLKGVDLFGPKLTNQSPALVTSGAGPLNGIRVTFNEAIDVASFTPEDVTLYGPMGGLIPVTVSAVVGSGDRQFDLAFADQTLRGAYRLTIGPDVTDVVGNPMNQDGNASNGEATDLYSSTVSFESTTPTLGSAPVLFSEGFESWASVPDYWSFGTAGTGTVAGVTSDSPKAGLQHLRLQAFPADQWAILKLDLSAHTNATDLFLDFWARMSLPDYSGQLRLELSGNGTTWRSVLANRPLAGYQNFVIDLDAELAAGGIALDSDVYVRFRQERQNAHACPSHEIFLDEVRVTQGNPTLLLSVAPTGFPEDAGAAAAYGTIKRINSTNLAEEVVVTLAGPTNAVILPESVTIAANVTETNFFIGVVDDGVPAGSRQAIIRASATGFADSSATVTLVEATPAQIGLTLSGTSVSEAAGVSALSGFVTRDRGLDTNLVVSLSSSDTTELTAPSSVTIPANSTTAFFALDAHNDGDIDGTQTVTITAAALGYVSRAASVGVTDDDSTGNRTLGGTLSGTISTGVYRVISSVMVNSNQTVTIAPGSHLLFSAGQALTVAGTLIADGEVGSEIVFSSDGAAPSPGGWTGIRFTGSAQAFSLLDHVEVSYAQNGIGIYVDDAHMTLTSSLVQSNSGDGIQVSMWASQFIEATDVQIVGNEFRYNGANGINLSVFAGCHNSSTIYAPIIGNEVHDNGGAGICARGDGSGAYICYPKGAAVVGSHISQNRLYSNQFGIHAEGYTDTSGYSDISPLIENNLIVSNRAEGIWLKEDVYATIVNNTIAGNLGSGIYHNLRVSPTPVAENNVIIGNTAGIVSDNVITNTPTVWYNDVFGNPGGDWVNYPAEFGNLDTANRNGMPADVYQNISADPLFTVGGDFRLLAGSPCVNAGNSTNAPTSDFEGQWREIPDIGWDEFPLPPRLLPPVVLPDGQVRLTVVGQPGEVLTLLAAPDLTHWVELGDYTNLTGVLVVTNLPPVGAAAYFYRLEPQ